MAGKTIELRSSQVDRAIRAGAFELLPVNPVPPYINSQPIKNINQYTWVVSRENGIPQYQTITPRFNVVRMLKGTAFSFEVRASDPSNVNDNQNLSDVSYYWRKDGSPMVGLNILNGGTGLSGVYIDEANCTPAVSGEYTCELTNQYGTTTTNPIQIEVVDPLNFPKLHKNLILNGDGDGGLDGWQGDTDIVSLPFMRDPFHTKNFASFRLGGFITFNEDSEETNYIPMTFRFGDSSNDSLFYKRYFDRYQYDPTFQNAFTPSDPYTMSNQDRWFATSLLPQIIANEDYNRSEFGGFFPGLAWMDLYNKNDGPNLIGLLSETRNSRPTYFTRKPIKFQKYGGKPTATMTQNIDINDVADMVDGSVYGVKYLTAQFFAYIGIGITDYKIKVQSVSGEKVLNYYVADSEEMYNRVIGKVNAKFPKTEAGLLGTPTSRIQLLPNTDIEIIPQCYDKTNVTLTYLDQSGNILQTQRIEGPDETDIWALKEKTYFPASLYGLFEFIQPDNNTIKVFGQKYTDTNALSTFFRQNEFGLFGKPHHKAGDTVALPTGITDKSVIHLLTKYDWREWKAPYPGKIYFATNTTDGYWLKAIPDYGAAAMIGVGENLVVPPRTRTIRVQVTFTHASEMFYDPDPNIKGWKSQELYGNEYGASNYLSRRLVEYGNPRCGISKMKLILIPNKPDVSDQHITYNLPPATSTVLGLQKRRYSDPSAFDTAGVNNFTYYFLQPDGVPTAPPPTSPFVNTELTYSYVTNQQQTTSQNSENDLQNSQEDLQNNETSLEG